VKWWLIFIVEWLISAAAFAAFMWRAEECVDDDEGDG
jgi:hypothetical protein